MKDQSNGAPAPSPFAGGGEMGERMRSHDWSTSPLGHPESWPQPLKTVVGIVLNARQPMFAAWGPELALVYNDTYAPLLGAKHPGALGRPFAEVWSDIWSQFRPIVEQTLAGQASWYEDLHIPMARFGYAEDTWFSFSYTPISDETGRVRGLFCACTETTGKVAGERALRESEERFRLAADGSPALMWMSDDQGEITFANQQYRRFFGVGAEEMLGDGWRKIVHPEDVDTFHAAFLSAFAAREPVHLSVRVLHPTLGVRWLTCDGRPRLDEAGGFLGYVGVNVDVTEVVTAEAALRESEADYRAAAELNPQVTWTARPDGQLDRVSQRWREWTGTSGLGETWAGGLHPNDVPSTFEAWGRSVATGAPYDIEHRVKFLNGEFRWARSRAFSRRNEAGEIVRWYGTTEDIHDQKTAQEALRENERRFRTLADNIAQLAWTTDESGSITWYNQRWYDYTGTTFEEMQGWGWKAVHHPEHVDQVVERFTAALALGAEWEDTFPLRSADGSYRWFLSRARPITDDGGRLTGWFGTNTDITQLRSAEAALAESEARFRTIADSIDVMIWSSLPDGNHDYFNRRWYDYTGLPEGSSDGESWNEVFHPEDQPRSWEVWRRSLETGEPYRIEYRLRHSSGQYRWVLGRALPVRDAEGRITRWYGTCTDINDQKIAEAQLRAILDSVPVGILMAEAPDGRVVQANRYLETLLRRPVRIGVPNYEQREAFNVHGARLDAADWPVSKVLRTGEQAEAEVRFRKGDDSLGWMRIQAAPVRDVGGEVIGAVAGVTDLQEIVEAREVLARSHINLERRVEEATAERNLVWTVSQDLFVICGFDGLYQSVNPAWSDALGYEEHELVGSRFDALVHPEDVAGSQREFLRLVAGEVVRSFDLRLRARDGRYRWYSWTCVPAPGEIFYAAGRDVTERKELEEQLRQAQKMEAVGQLTGGIAHDFNNLLQIVVGNLELTQRNLPDDSARLKRSVDNAMTGAKRAATLTQRLLAFSRRQPLAPKPVSVNKLVAGMSELLGRSLGETIQVETVLAGGLWRVEADPNQLENAIVNLAVNARDAMPAGGKLTIETANTRLDESYAQQNVEVAPGQYVVICVSDTGIGMTKEEMARAFEPFFTTKGVGKGTGLGLSQVYGFVKQSGGHVKIYSETADTPDHHSGTTVKIYMPRYLGPGEEGADEPEDAAAPEGGPGETILVVEDDPDVRAYTVEVLRELGYGVVEAADGAAALKLLRDAQTRCDLLFTDVVLPGGMNGEQLATEAHEARPGLKVLFTTGYARNAIVHHGRLDPGVKLITKPFTYADLAARVRDVLDEPGPDPAQGAEG